MAGITQACIALGERTQEHLGFYGYNYQARLTGEHETCSYREYRYGVADRTASVRIPRHVADRGFGYFADRRPNANADPYLVASVIVDTIESYNA